VKSKQIIPFFQVKGEKVVIDRSKLCLVIGQPFAVLIHE
jgi:hypothetical protein